MSTTTIRIEDELNSRAASAASRAGAATGLICGLCHLWAVRFEVGFYRHRPHQDISACVVLALSELLHAQLYLM